MTAHSRWLDIIYTIIGVCSDPSFYSFCAMTAVSFVSLSPASRPALTGARLLFVVTLSSLNTFVS
jgi:hypothetical protein